MYIKSFWFTFILYKSNNKHIYTCIRIAIDGYVWDCVRYSMMIVFFFFRSLVASANVHLPQTTIQRMAKKKKVYIDGRHKKQQRLKYSSVNAWNRNKNKRLNWQSQQPQCVYDVSKVNWNSTASTNGPSPSEWTCRFRNIQFSNYSI